MTSINHNENRELQQDARAWADFTGTKYTSAFRQMCSPLAQGFLGERVSARRLIETLDHHEVIGSRGGNPMLGEHGVFSDTSWIFDRGTEFIELALITDMLRMFTPLRADVIPEVSSSSLKHTAENFLALHCSNVSNGRLIWAAASLGLKIAGLDVESPNLFIGISEREHDYVSRMVIPGSFKPRGSRYRPAGYEHLQAEIARCASDVSVDSSTSLAGIRTERIRAFGGRSELWEHYEYLCVCGDGQITEEHDHTPGYREHFTRIDCDKCRAEWRFIADRTTREWALEPLVEIIATRL